MSEKIYQELACKEYYTTKDVAELFGLTEYTIRKKIREHELDAIPGASVREGYRITKDAVIEYAAKNKIPLSVTAKKIGEEVIAQFTPAVVINSSILELAIKRLHTEIDGLNLRIRALQLEDELRERDKKKRLLNLQIQINDLEGEIQVLKLHKELIRRATYTGE